MKDTYITALLELIESGQSVDTILDGFQKTLNARGHERLFVPVLRGVLRTLDAARPKTELIVAREVDVMKYRTAIEEALAKLGADAGDAVIHKDDTIIGGYIVEHADARLDASYKTKLVNLYRSLTN